MRLPKINQINWKLAAIIMNLTYSSYSVFAYSLVGQTTAIRTVLMAITFMTYVVALCKISQKEMFTMLKIYLLMGVVFGLHYVLFENNREFLSGILCEFAMIVPFMSLIGHCTTEELKKVLLCSAYILLFCNIIEPITKYTISMERGYMIYGFRFIPAAVIFTGFALMTGRKRYWVFAAVSLAETLLLGNRSTLIVFKVFLVLYILFATNLKKKLLCSAIAGGGVGLLYLMNIPDMITKTAHWLAKRGISSRSLMMLINNEYDKDNGRLVTWDKAIEYIKEKPFFGYGIGSDRTLRLNAWNADGYVHNVALEIMLDFGVIIALAACIFILFMIFKRLIQEKNIDYKFILIVFVSCAVPKLCVSGTFWSEPYFWNMLAVIFSSTLRGQGGLRRT